MQTKRGRRFRCICMFGLCMRALLSLEYKMGRCILFVLFIDPTLVSWKIETMCIQRINFMCVNYIYDLFYLYKLLFLPVCFSHFPGVRTSWFNSSMEWKKISYLGGSPYHDSCTISYRQDRKAHGMTCIQYLQLFLTRRFSSKYSEVRIFVGTK